MLRNEQKKSQERIRICWVTSTSLEGRRKTSSTEWLQLRTTRLDEVIQSARNRAVSSVNLSAGFDCKHIVVLRQQKVMWKQVVELNRHSSKSFSRNQSIWLSLSRSLFFFPSIGIDSEIENYSERVSFNEVFLGSVFTFGVSRLLLLPPRDTVEVFPRLNLWFHPGGT